MARKPKPLMAPPVGRDEDTCKCGDYRRQHQNGTGACKICEWNGPVRCERFEMASESSQ
jgi:hypothetical protein